VTIFQTIAYREAYRAVFGRGKRFLEVGIAENTAWFQTRGTLTKRLEFWAQGIADCGGASLEDTEQIGALWSAIETEAAKYDGAQLIELNADSPLVECARRSGWIVEPAEVCPTLVLPPTYEEYVKSLGKNMREQIKRYPKRLDKEFETSYEMAQTEEQVSEFLGELFELHGKRWRARGQTGVLALPSRQRFHRLICQKFLEEDWLRLWRLKCDGKTVCVLLCYFWGDRYWFFLGGFEPTMQKWSVGTCLFARIFQTAIEEGAKEFDFLRGAEEYKYRYGATDRHFVTLKWFSSSARGRLLRRKTNMEEAFMHRLHEKFSAAHKGK
jgi:CelD/BcsL family acetyltransferase involved in cellulose biosynthesis